MQRKTLLGGGVGHPLRPRTCRSPLAIAIVATLVLVALVALLDDSPNAHAGDAVWLQPPREREHLAAAQTAQPTHSPGLRLLLASHARLLDYDSGTGESRVLHEGQGVHYGVVPGDKNGDVPHGNGTLWFVLRPHNWHPASSQEFMVQLDLHTGAELRRVQVATRFAHDAVRVGDAVYVCSTQNGELVQLDAHTMTERRRLPLFTTRQHVNTLLPMEGPHSLLAMLHNLGRSSIVSVDVGDAKRAASIIATLPKAGTKAHGLAVWGRWLLFLDSEGGRLCRAALPPPHITAPDDASGWVLGAGGSGGTADAVQVIYQVPQPPVFLKGLCVVGDVAYFGINRWAARHARTDPDLDAELAAYDLAAGQLLWRRQVPTHGLLNAITSPDAWAAGLPTAAAGLRAGATPKPSATASGIAPALPETAPEAAHHQDASSSVEKAFALLQQQGGHGVVGGTWPSGRPRLDMKLKGGDAPWEAGAQLPLVQLDVSAIKALLAGLPPQMWTSDYQEVHNAGILGRESNLSKFKPGISTMYLIFSARDISHAYIYPFYQRFRAAVEPLLTEVLGAAALHRIVRLQFASMAPGSIINLHRDQGGYATRAHRIHIPITTNSDVDFEVTHCADCDVYRDSERMISGGSQVCLRLDTRIHEQQVNTTEDQIRPGDCLVLPTPEGLAFEVNNRVLHRAINASPSQPRVHLVIDVAETDVQRHALAPGTLCAYASQGSLVCPPGSITNL